MLKKLKLQAAKLLLKLEEVTTDKGVLICDGELVVGKEVFSLDENGEYITAVDGTYVETLENDAVNTYEVLDGVISDVKLAEVPVIVEEPEVVEVEAEVVAEVEPIGPTDIELVIADLVQLMEDTNKRIDAVEALLKEMDKKSIALSADELLKTTKGETKSERMATAFTSIKRK